jgi:hypothetical protein
MSAMTKAGLIAALIDVPDHAEVRVFVDESFYEREENDQLDIKYVDTYYVRRPITAIPFVILHLQEADDDDDGDAA